MPNDTENPDAPPSLPSTVALRPIAEEIADLLMTSYVTNEGVLCERLALMKARDGKLLAFENEKEMGGLCRSAVVSRIEMVLEERGLIASATADGENTRD